MSKSKDLVIEYYQHYWPKFVQWWAVDETLGIHYGYFEKGIHTHKEAILNMNDYVWSLIGLENRESSRILDAGCGVGGTSIYLAKKYPNVEFIGLAISSEQINLANNLAKKYQVKNVKFKTKSYLDTGLPDNYLDAIFALESVCYQKDKKDFMREAYRILKPGGKLVVLDGFLIRSPSNPIVLKIYKSWCRGRRLSKLESPKYFMSSLSNEGFTDINCHNLGKNIRRSAFRGFLIGIPFFFSSMLKRIIKLGKYEPDEDPDWFLGLSVIGTFLGINGVNGYYAITAIKNNR